MCYRLKGWTGEDAFDLTNELIDALITDGFVYDDVEWKKEEFSGVQN